MNKLRLIISTEYKTDISSKSFWIATFLVPLIMIGFSIFGAFMMESSDSFMSLSKEMTPGPDSDDISGPQVLGMMMGILLVLFLMMYGSQIFNKVKVEKCNRIYEVLATCVDGRTMMMAKIISVGLVGLTQLMIWFSLIVMLLIAILTILPVPIPMEIFLDSRLYLAILWSILFFIGGYLFYGSLFAAIGAMTDKNNENQEYVAVMSFILLACFYIGEFAVDNGTGLLATICSFIPFTSPVVACVNAITGAVPLWQSVLALILLYLFAGLSVSLSGKIYTSSMLLKGKKLTPSDIVTFFKSK